MSYLVKQTRGQLADAIQDAAQKAAACGDLPHVPTAPFQVESPADSTNGDFSANAAMVWAKELRMSPRKIAEAICVRIALDGATIDRCEVAGAGFLNFYCSDAYFAAILLDVNEKGECYGRSNFGQGKRVNVEYVSANPTGPMHLGNARGGALGDCLSAVLQAAGYDVTREFYVNDAGSQIRKLAISLDVRYQQIFLGAQAPELPTECYQGADIVALAREFAKTHGEGFLQKPEWERREALIAYALPKNIAQMKKTLDGYRIHYDVWFSESTLHENGEIARVIALLKEKGLTYERDGALWYKVAEDGADKDEVLIRESGFPSYFAADIAYHCNKLATRGFDHAINIWGADHHGHVARMQGVLDALGLDGSHRLEIILIQLVRLVSGGEVVRMSKRSGKAITLEVLLDEIPVDAARFFFNMRDPSTQMEFDLDLAVQETAQNPVYYCQYAHARICSIFRKLQEEGVVLRGASAEDLRLLTAPEERTLIRLLASLTDEIIRAAESRDPARITRYCMGLSAAYHKFYAVCPVKSVDDSLMQARLCLCAAVRGVLKNLLGMFKITVPEQM
ncbi:MAG: arginine--tRNA ligase [Oscillospiraceae bacterium]|jgi:arginyl-tRNA synthetase|nr:arginine--tRNA ligase [Oscillospiraceae bacterium]